MSNFSAISWREKVKQQWNYDDVSFVLDQQKIQVLFTEYFYYHVWGNYEQDLNKMR
jgi:hypothetical protein